MSKILGVNSPKPEYLKNYIINGNFDIWQRGTSFSTITSIYTADRWHWNHYGSGFQPSSASQATAGIENNSKYYFKHITSTATSQNIELSQTLDADNTIPLRGKNVTLSMRVRFPTAFTTSATAYLMYHTAETKIGAAVGTIIASVDLGASTSWTTIILTGMVPTNAIVMGILISNYNNIVNGAELNISKVMLNEGPVAAPFQTAGANIEEELSMCQRYCYKLAGPASGVRSISTGTLSSSTNVGRTPIVFPVTMRITPTVTFNSLAAYDGSALSSISALAANYTNDHTFDADWTTSGLGGA
mgnify:FL=1